MKKIIITAAITGGIHTPGMSPYLPITPEQIIEDAVKACESGAATLHIHARNPETGKPTSDLETMAGIISEIKKRCDAAICITTGGSPGMSIEERISAIPRFKPELASCNAGSVNFVLSPAARKLEAKYDWEKPFLLGTHDFVFNNTYKGIEHYVNTMNEADTLPEFEVYDVGMINNISFFKKTGIIKKPVYIQFIMGILGGIPATVENLSFLVKTAKQQLGEDVNWSVAGAGKAQFPMAAAALSMGGNVRVGLEDNLYNQPRQFAKCSAEQVLVVKEMAEKLGYAIATPNEAREILSLKGKENTSF